ncbi:hypothetical protein ACSQ67_008439 [Phaseolus vulgaris]
MSVVAMELAVVALDLGLGLVEVDLVAMELAVVALDMGSRVVEVGLVAMELAVVALDMGSRVVEVGLVAMELAVVALDMGSRVVAVGLVAKLGEKVVVEVAMGLEGNLGMVAMGLEGNLGMVVMGLEGNLGVVVMDLGMVAKDMEEKRLEGEEASREDVFSLLCCNETHRRRGGKCRHITVWLTATNEFESASLDYLSMSPHFEW